MARPPFVDPSKRKTIQLVVRLDAAQSAFVRAEVDRLNRENPGLGAGMSDVVRMALAEAMATRARHKTGKEPRS